MLPIQLSLFAAISFASLSTSIPIPVPLPLPTLAVTQRSVTATGDDSAASWLSQRLAARAVAVNIPEPQIVKRSHASRPIYLAPREVKFNAPPPRFVPRGESSSSPKSGINNATINLTVISKKSTVPVPAANARQEQIKARRALRGELGKRALEEAKSISARSPTPSPEPKGDDDETAHHNIYIDASGGGEDGLGGGITNSTINVNIITNSKKEKRETSVGENSVLLDLSDTPDGIEDSTVHVNILPARSPSPVDNAIGDHSILINASGDLEGDLSAGDHSAVVSSSINSSTINLTVVSAKDEEKDGADSERLAKRDAQLAERADQLVEWEDQVSKMKLPAVDEEDTPEPLKWIRQVALESDKNEERRALHVSHDVSQRQ